MSKVYMATGTVRTYFVSDETEGSRLEKIGREVIDDTIEYYGEDCIDVQVELMESIDDVPSEDRGDFVFVRSDEYVEDTELTVEKALKEA